MRPTHRCEEAGVGAEVVGERRVEEARQVTLGLPRLSQSQAMKKKEKGISHRGQGTQTACQVEYEPLADAMW